MVKHMGKESFEKIRHKIEDRMLLGSIYDNIMLKLKYNDKKLSFNYNVMMAQKHRMLYYKRLKKQLLAECTAKRDWEKQEKVKNSDTIWMCWLQGMEKAPLLVQRCYESIQKNIPGKKIILLDESNIFEYISLPDDIVEKWKKGIIGAAHFTDLVRLQLLITHGGYWIDATVLCTDGKLFQCLDKEPLFMYSF